jgi:hypothetical protein
VRQLGWALVLVNLICVGWGCLPKDDLSNYSSAAAGQAGGDAGAGSSAGGTGGESGDSGAGGSGSGTPDASAENGLAGDAGTLDALDGSAAVDGDGSAPVGLEDRGTAATPEAGQLDDAG